MVSKNHIFTPCSASHQWATAVTWNLNLVNWCSEWVHLGNIGLQLVDARSDCGQCPHTTRKSVIHQCNPFCQKEMLMWISIISLLLLLLWRLFFFPKLLHSLLSQIGCQNIYIYTYQIDYMSKYTPWHVMMGITHSEVIYIVLSLHAPIFWFWAILSMLFCFETFYPLSEQFWAVLSKFEQFWAVWSIFEHFLAFVSNFENVWIVFVSRFCALLIIFDNFWTCLSNFK